MQEPTGRGVEAPRRAEDLPQRLRRETADLHRRTEQAVDLPGSVRTRHDYAGLLGRLLRFHVAAEDRLSEGRWQQAWRDLGVDLRSSGRSHLLVRDLAELGRSAPPPPSLAPSPAVLAPFPSFGRALGALYVLEGSSLGGRLLGPAITAVVGDVPTAFFSSDGRGHPNPWRAVQRGLRRYEERGLPTDEVLRGAEEAFVAFARHVAVPARPPAGVP